MIQRSLMTLLALGALALTACGGESGTESGGDDKAASAPDPNNVIARVNGEAITAPQLQAQLQAMSQRGQRASRQQALQELVELELMAQKAEEQGLPDQAEIAAAIERQRNTLLAQHLVRSQMSEFEVSDEKLKSAYDKRVSDTGGTEYKARHIKVDKEAKAKSLIEELDGGADFAELAKEHSTGPSKSRGGDLGWFTPDRMVGPIASAVQELEPGNYAGEPIKTKFGWHVLKLEDTRDKEPPKFEQMKSRLRNELVGQKVQDYITSLRDKAEIEITEDELKSDAGGGSGDGDAGESGAEDDSGESSGDDA